MADIYGYDYAVRKYCKECGKQLSIRKKTPVLLCEEHMKDYYRMQYKRKPNTTPETVIQARRRKRAGLVCELYFGKHMDIKEIAKETGIHYATVGADIERYFGKNEVNKIGVKSQIFATED